MKPRIRYCGGVWSCASCARDRRDRFLWRIGYGYTPSDAYRDWEAQG